MLRLRTFGSVDLLGPDDRDLRPVLAQPKRLALLVYLAASRPVGVHRRDELLALFWPDLDDARARDALNQALRFLRQALGAETFVKRGAEDVGIDPARLWCDAVVFQSAVDGGRPAEALELYRGDFLQGFFIEEGGGFEEWMERERAAHRETAARGARQLAEENAAGGALTLAIDWGRRALELAPDDERALRRLMRWHDQAGDRAGAFRVYEAFLRRLEQEFGGEPAPETRALAERLKSGQPLDVVAPSRPATPPRSEPQPPVAAAGASGGQLGDLYRIEREIGSGGMARVYLGRDLKHDREVAIKVLRPEIVEGLARERFIREIRIAGRLQHPNIVPLFDSGEADGRLFYVMPHVQGETLRDRLAREGALPVDDVVHILRELAGALAYAHGQGIIHRDIKPANILLMDRRAVLADFGIARAAHAARTPAGIPEGTLTQLGVSLGTPTYMAPEQAGGNPEIDHRADLYALGVVAYEMLAGRPPFVADTPQQVLAAQLLQPPLPIAGLRPDTPAGLGALVMRCLEKKPAGRPESAQAFRGELEGGRPVVRAASRWWRRPVLLAASGVLLLGALWIMVNAWSSWKGRRSTTGAAATTVAIDAIPPLDPRRIAVLYFEDLTPTKTLEHVANGLTEDLIDALSQVRGLNVISPNGVRPFRVMPRPVDSLSKELGVGTIVSGSVVGSNGSLRVSVRLIDGSSARQLQHFTTQQPMSDVLQLRDTLTAEVTKFLRERLGREIRLREERVGTKSAEAWELVQEADEARRQGSALGNVDQPAAAKELLERADVQLMRAEALDTGWIVPTLRRARVALSLSFVSPAPSLASDASIRLGFDALQRGRLSANWLSRALELTERVLARAPGSPEALAMRGELRFRLVTLAFPAGPDSLLALARTDLGNALNARPDLARAWNVLGQLLRNEGRFAEAAQAARNAFEADAYLDDAQAVLNDLFQSALYLERPEEARSRCRTGIERFPKNPNFVQCELTLLGWTAKGRRQVDAAWRLLGDVERRDSAGVLSPMWGFRRMLIAAVLARSGLDDSARAVIQRVRRETPNHPGSSDVTDIEAYVRLQLGERDTAIRLIETYLDVIPSARAYVARNPWYRALHTDPRFRTLVGLTG